MMLRALLALALGGCSQGVWDAITTIGGPTPREVCEHRGGRWAVEQVYDPRTGALIREEQRCITARTR